MQKVIEQVQEASNFLWYIRTKKVVEILEWCKDKRKRTGKYLALYLEWWDPDEPMLVGCKSKVDAIIKFIDAFHTHSSVVAVWISFDQYKKYKKDGVFSL